VKQDPARSRAAGDYLTHRFNPELGIGRVSALDGRALIVDFPRSGATLRLAAARQRAARQTCQRQVQREFCGDSPLITSTALTTRNILMSCVLMRLL